MKKKNYSSLFFYLLLIIAVLIMVSVMLSDGNREDVDYSDLMELFQTEKVDSFEVTGQNVVVIRTKDGREIEYPLRDFNLFYTDFHELIAEQKAAGIITDFDYKKPSSNWWISFIPTLLLALALIFLFVFVFRTNGAGGGGKINSFGKAHARLGTDDSKKVTFRDVAGADEEKEELREIVEFLKNPERYTRLGAKIPHGVLLQGPPGTGKTLLAKAVAGEAGVPFYSISGSDFVEMYVGVGASRVRDLFDTAKKNPASIIFIDEIDAVGRHRGAGLGGGHDEREQTLNQLLVEMDGFGSNDGVIVIAATNRPDILDPALLRPGRFDRQITVNYPDIKGREDILKVHARGKPFESDVDLSVIAKTTVGFTGADLANLLNEAALHAARKGKSLIGMDDIEEASIKIIVGGPQKKSKKVREEEKKMTAYHEAGHAILGKLVLKNNTIHQISIIPAGRAGGYTINRPNQDQGYYSAEDMMNDIVMDLGGRAAEMIVFGHLTTGASSDISHATNMARSMVTRYGMSEKLGTVVYGSEHSSDEVFLGRDFSSGKNYSEETAALIDSEIKRIVEDCYAKALSLLKEHFDKLTFVAEFLIRNETMDEDTFNAAMDEDVTIEELEARQAEKREKSKQANDKKAADDEAKRLAEEAERRKNDAAEDPYEALRRHQEEAYGNLTDDKADEKDPADDNGEDDENGENKND
ncbi:MAG: ATP-dependent zinc metalloprotease FtsH [Lachnospiraceae bacterium]|nr:ATP-dependent zinc metalloprotease FtsH [Lachnospiraceae bacterium]